MCFRAFGQCFHVLLDTTLQKQAICKRAASKLPIIENIIEKLPLVRFSLPFLFRQTVEKLVVLFG